MEKLCTIWGPIMVTKIAFIRSQMFDDAIATAV